MSPTKPLLLGIFLALLTGLPLLKARATLHIVELIINGDMENDQGWVFPVTAAPGGYVTDHYLSPQRSARMGLTAGPNRFAFSSMRQTVDIPALPPQGSLVLRWATLLRSVPVDPNDRQYLLIQNDRNEYETLWSLSGGNTPSWQQCSFDLRSYAGQTITLHFGVKNDGQNGLSAMYVDDVSLLWNEEPQQALQGCVPITPTPGPSPTVSPTATPTPAATPSPSPTPSPFPPTPTVPPTSTPGTCHQLLQNPGFQQGYQGWHQNLYLTASYTDTKGETHLAAWLGGADFVDQYLYQDATLPAGRGAHLTLHWALEPGQHMAPGEALTLTLRTPQGQILAPLLQINQESPARDWRTALYDLSPYAGQRVRVHARAITQTGAPSWYLDDIQLYDCAPPLLDQHLHLPIFWRDTIHGSGATGGSPPIPMRIDRPRWRVGPGS